MEKQEKNNIVESILSISMLGATSMIIAAPNFYILRVINEYSVHIMLTLLGISMIAMFAKSRRTMYAALACTAALSIWLKNASNADLKLPTANQEVNLKVAHVNLGNIDDQFDEMVDIFTAEDVDIISFQELTPDWANTLKNKLVDYYPHSFSQVRIDPYGMGVYSKHELTLADTIMAGSVPSVSIQVTSDDKNFHILSSYLTPALDKKSSKLASNQLRRISRELTKHKNHNCIALGEFNMVYWAQEIRNFRSECNLHNSRRDIVKGNLRVPYDHIFYSEGLECTRFEEVYSNDRKYIGILGTYQIKSEEISSLKRPNIQLSSI